MVLDPLHHSVGQSLIKHRKFRPRDLTIQNGERPCDSHFVPGFIPLPLRLLGRRANLVFAKQAGTNSQQMHEAVLGAESIQDERFGARRGRRNAQMSSREIRSFCPLDRASQELLKSSVHELGLSARAHDKVLRVSRTIADLDAADKIAEHHLVEAINYRLLDRQIWS